MTHSPSDIIVNKTSDYSRFCMISGNRGLNESKIKKIIKEIDSGNDMLRYYPILVKEIGKRLEILEGQHRYFISTKLNRPVHYIIVTDPKTMSDIARVNSNVEKWRPQDFINCYINNNNEHYQKLQSFLDLYRINIGTSLRMLSTGTPGAEGSNDQLKDLFEKGQFKVTHWDEAVALADSCKLFEAFEHWRDRGFIIAIYRIKKAGLIDIDVLHTAFAKSYDMLVKNASQKQYVYNLEQIVNKNKQNRIIII